MKTYRHAYTLGFKKSFRYQANFYLGFVSIIFPLTIQFFMWKGMYSSSSSDTLFGYKWYQMVQYAIFAALVSKLIQASFAYEITNDIKEGGLAKYLVKPLSYFRYQFFCFIGEKTAIIATSTLILILVWVGFQWYFDIQMKAMNLLFFFLALVLAMFLNFIILYSAGCIGFWMIDASSVIFIFMLVSNIVSGGVFPLDIFDGHVQTVLKLLPFGYTNYFCTSILCGRLSLVEIAEGFILQIFWILACYGLHKILWKAGLKRYVAVGG